MIGHRLFHGTVYLPPQLPGPIWRAGLGCQCGTHPGRVGQLVAVAGGAGFQLGQQLFRNAAHALIPQRAEDDELIQPPDELGPEPLLCLGDGTAFQKQPLRRLQSPAGRSGPPENARPDWT